LTSRSAQEAIRQVRGKAAQQRQAIDEKIGLLKEEEQSNREKMLSAIAKEKESRAEAALHYQRGLNWSVKIGPRGRVTRHVSPNYKQQGAADAKRNQAAQHQEEAEKYGREVSRLNTEIRTLKTQSGQFAIAAMPSNGTLPGKVFWEGLSSDQRDELSRVGISQDQLRILLSRIGQTEASFVASAHEMEQSSHSGDELTLRLRQYFQERLQSQANNAGVARRPAIP
jgi:hypothetical protein